MTIEAPRIDPDRGLTAAEVADRVAQGRVNRLPPAPGRTTAQIVRANVFTPINGIIGVMFVLIMVAAPGPDALFAGVIVSNTLIGIIQELRARATLNRLEVLSAPLVRVRRDGGEVEVAVEEVVADDVLVVGPGEQVVVDGEVLQSDHLEMNESLLTGEADAVVKRPGDLVMSGSFVAAGSGCFRATAVGADSYAASLAEEARRFTLTRSELREGINRILKALMIIIPPIALLLLLRLLAVEDSWQEALRGTVAGSVSMVPDGLVLLTSVSFMAGVLAIARRRGLMRELASVEVLARVDVLCLDKTGTITTGEMHVGIVLPVDGVASETAQDALGAMASADPDPNATLAAIKTHCPCPEGWQVEDRVPFASSRKWSAVAFVGQGAWYLGAPERLLDPDDPRWARAFTMVGEQTAAGRRVVLLCRAAGLVGEDRPEDLEPMAVVALEDRVREDAPEILRFFSEQGTDLKVISGDHPATVAAVAARAGIPGAERCMDAVNLPEDPEALAAALDEYVVFGRVTPHQKRAMVGALQSRGHVVGMTGDGVNDVLALKDADMGIAMGSGSAASKAVAQLVLLDSRFGSLPAVVAEGRRVINSVERAANLFIVGTVAAVFFSLLTAAVGIEYPFLPRHMTLIRTLSVGVPGFFLALAPDPRPVRPGFVRRVLRFALPAGLLASVCAFLTFQFLRNRLPHELIDQARTGAVLVLVVTSLAVLEVVSRQLSAWRLPLIACMSGGFALSLVLPRLHDLFLLDLPPTVHLWVVALASVVAVAGLNLIWWADRRLDSHDTEQGT